MTSASMTMLNSRHPLGSKNLEGVSFFVRVSYKLKLVGPEVNAMAVAVGDVVKCVAKLQDLNGSLIENIWFYRNDGTASVSNTDFLTAVETELSSLYTYFQSYLPSSLDTVSIACDIVIFISGKLTVSQPVGDVPWTTWSGGTGTGAGLPQGCAAVVNFPTVSPGVVGRKFFGPMTVAAQDDGELDSTFQGQLASFVTDYLGGMSVAGETFDPVLMSTKYAAYRDISSGIINSVVGYQRRRKAGVGV